MKRVFFTVALALAFGSAAAQAQPLRLDLETAVQLALSENPTVKIADMEVDRHYLSRIALFAPEARLSYIKNFEVAEKIKLTVPDTIEGGVRCANPVCVTNHEKVTPKFDVVDKSRITLRCRYCEKITTVDQFEIIK